MKYFHAHQAIHQMLLQDLTATVTYLGNHEEESKLSYQKQYELGNIYLMGVSNIIIAKLCIQLNSCASSQTFSHSSPSCAP